MFNQLNRYTVIGFIIVSLVVLSGLLLTARNPDTWKPIRQVIGGTTDRSLPEVRAISGQPDVIDKSQQQNRARSPVKQVATSASDKTLQDLIVKSQLPNSTLHPVEKTCSVYQEFRRLNFNHPAVKSKLCSNAVAYIISNSEYPICVLQSPFSEDMLDVVRQGSDIVGLLDMQNIKLPFFVYKGYDYISSQIKNTGSWEPGLVHWTLRFALKLPDVTFLDMGSNIGVYSIQAAKLGLPVVALDANIRNLLRLRLSLDAASRDATLVWNFIAPDQTVKYLSFLRDCNVGGAGREKSDLPDTVPVMPLRSERIGDLIKTKNVVMKMDIQGGEVDFLLTSGRLFTDFNVAAVQMEWSPSFIRGKDSLVMSSFFINKGYKVWRVPGFSALDTKNIPSWGEIDIMWVHKDFVRMM